MARPFGSSLVCSQEPSISSLSRLERGVSGEEKGVWVVGDLHQIVPEVQGGINELETPAESVKDGHRVQPIPAGFK